MPNESIPLRKLEYVMFRDQEELKICLLSNFHEYYGESLVNHSTFYDYLNNNGPFVGEDFVWFY
jgi:hypothetical protein